ncbi:MAG: NADH-quinone oxidoreductase subunit C [Antarcticimicrobium sp.]|uniref:hydrogenase large subunit n=1 Tax=Antarcticimicrobium sp. TaxID=2824147 RepID=UPI00260975CB|nr:NADH-quinone oxidoreductase subunit C [Antarcticimicrobium sp.]MDF1717118.1 NADH-quinone oxidoreductase subunit C [Antarcticimicrobium sp.]
MSRPPKLLWTRSRDFRALPFQVSDVPPAGWTALGTLLAEGKITLLGLWAEAPGVAMALYDPATRRVAVTRVRSRRGAVPSIGASHPPAQRLERAAADLTGLRFENAPDPRPWLDHGRWDIAHPLAGGAPHPGQPPYAFLPVKGESLHQVPVGPVHAGTIEPGHFRFTAQGETVVRLEERLGYVHKGIERLMQGADLARGAELAGRVSGDSTVAYAWAFAQAAEAALEIEVPARAFFLRGIMAELERLANHLGDFGAICNDAAFSMMLAQASVLREEVLRAASDCFGHRFMRDRIVPGGVTADLSAEGASRLRALLDRIRDRFPVLVDLYDNTASLLDRTVGTGWLSPTLAGQFGAGGFVGRASGRDYDTRRDLRYAPYDMVQVEVAGRKEGDVNARVWIRIKEVEHSLGLITQMLNTLPAGPILAEPVSLGETRSGLGLVEGFRGDILAWLSLDADGRIARCHMRDPSWFQWPLLEAVIEGNIIADFPLCNKSFNCSYSGHDL